jgi:hypothetical protein
MEKETWMSSAAHPGYREGAVAGCMSAVLLLSGTATTHALELLDLTGEMFIAGATLVDPPPDEARTQAYFTIGGDAALALYDGLPSPEEPDICRGEGRNMKSAGSLYCSITGDRSEAECSFVMSLETGEAAEGLPC